MLINYSYLWSGEARLGREEGIKDRPCAVVIVTRTKDGETIVRVLPVTHRHPTMEGEAVEIPMPTKHRLGLDSEPSWIVLGEMNDFPWPGPDVRPLRNTGNPVYGFLPRKFFRHVLEQLAGRRLRIVKRT
jgi:hypothetical protein